MNVRNGVCKRVEVSKKNFMGREDNIADMEQLVCRINARVDVGENMLLLYQQMKGLIYAIAKRYSGMAELEDLCQEGYLALHDAVAHYNPAAGAKFSGYAGEVIKRHMMRYIRENQDMSIPEYMQIRICQYRQLCNAFRLHYGREPFDREISVSFGLSQKQIAQLKKAAAMDKIKRLDASAGNGEEDIALADTIAADIDLEREVLEEVQQGQLEDVLWGVVDTLPGEQPEILKKHYKEDMPIAKIGECLGLSGNKVRNLEYKAFRELRREHREELTPFLPEYLEAKAYSFNGVAVFNRTWTSSTERTALELWKDSGQDT